MYKALSPRRIGVTAPFERCVELAAENGFEGIHLDDVPAIVRTDLARRKGVLDAFGIRAACFDLPVEFRADEIAYNCSIGKLPRMAKAARELGCSRCSTYILPYHDELDFQSNFELHSIRLGRIATILADYGIGFGLEFMAPKTLRDGHKFEFIYTMGGILELCDAIGTGSMGVLLDSWHWYNAHGTLDDFRRLCDELVINVHISDAPAGLRVDEQVDNVRSLPGETGIIDIVGFLRGLQQISYTGPVLVEPYSERVNRLADVKGVKVVAASLRDVWRKAGLKKGTN